MVQVKICGIRSPEHAIASVELGADLLGLILAPSRRRVEPELARTITAAARAAAARQGTTIKIVGVFVNEPPEQINRLVAQIGLDWAQLSGHEEPADAAGIVAPVVKAVRFDDHPSEARWLAPLGMAGAVDYHLLVDAHVQGSYGGAGVTGDWQRAAALARGAHVWLAGGLTPDNVAAAVQQVHPAVVDVSSGVETAGVKDVAKIQAFVRAARAAASQTDYAPAYQSTDLL